MNVTKRRKRTATPSVVVQLDAEPAAVVVLAEQLGALAADMWLDGEFAIATAQTPARRSPR